MRVLGGLDMIRRISCLILLGAVLPLLAQTTFGRISGTVTDPSGAAVPGANVVIRNTDTQAARIQKTDARGFYVAENLPIVRYSVQVDQPGFKRSSKTGLARRSYIFRSRRAVGWKGCATGKRLTDGSVCPTGLALFS